MQYPQQVFNPQQQMQYPQQVFNSQQQMQYPQQAFNPQQQMQYPQQVFNSNQQMQYPQQQVFNQQVDIKNYIEEYIKNRENIPGINVPVMNIQNIAKDSLKITQNNLLSQKIPIKPLDKLETTKPNYDIMTDDEKSKMRIIFEDNYTKLENSYSTWEIRKPNFYDDSLDLIHDRYEKIIKRIVIYQTAQKWKVYFSLAIAGVEYLLFKKYKLKFMEGFTKIQLKTLHRYDQYFIELSEKYHSAGSDEWPFYLKVGGTVGINVVVFAIINTLFGSGSIGENMHGIADQFISSGEGDANIKRNIIPDVPDVPSGYTSPDTLMSLLSMVYGGNSKPQENSVKQEEIPIANPIEKDNNSTTGAKIGKKRSTVFS